MGSCLLDIKFQFYKIKSCRDWLCNNANIFSLLDDILGNNENGKYDVMGFLL